MSLRKVIGKQLKKNNAQSALHAFILIPRQYDEIYIYSCPFKFTQTIYIFLIFFLNASITNLFY